jgi:site-specific recombinase XerD
MLNHDLISPWIRRFLLEYLIGERNFSPNTQASYRDALSLLLPFAARDINTPIDQLLIEDLSTDLLRRFLEYIEGKRNCSVSTRNQRLAAIHALSRFIGARSPEHLAWCTGLATIPSKRGTKGTLPYLEKIEMDALLTSPDRKSRLGARDYSVLLFLYNSGARADEAAKLTIADLDLGTSPAVRILGKGNKVRLCPLWKSTAEVLKDMLAGRGGQDRVFHNRRGMPMTRFGIFSLVERAAEVAVQRVPSLASKRVSPHVIRHTTAVHLLRAGVDINTIRAWLGHVSLDTTNIYAEVDFEMKAKALGACEISPRKARTPWHEKPGVMSFLKNLQRLGGRPPESGLNGADHR